jgi:hypothetical protein
MIDSQKLKSQTSYSLKLHDVRKAAAAYELMHSAAAMLQMLPVPVLEALRDYVQEEEVKDRKGPLTLCDRSFVEHLNELIRGGRLKSQASCQNQMKTRKRAANGACAPRSRCTPNPNVVRAYCLPNPITDSRAESARPPVTARFLPVSRVAAEAFLSR